MKPFLLFALILTTFSAQAHRPADGNIYAAFGPYIYQTQRYEEQFHSPIMMGGAAIVEGDLNKWGGLELTLAYMNPIFGIEREDKKVVEQVKRMYIAMGWRHWFGRDFSLSPSFWSSYVMGDAEIVRNDFVGVLNPPHTSARDPVDYGFALSAVYETAHMDNFSIIFDARYSYSVTPKPGEDMNQYGLIVAFKYFIQGRRPDQEEDEF